MRESDGLLGSNCCNPRLHQVQIVGLPVRTNVPLFGSVPFASGKSERRLEIEQYSGEGCSATRPKTLTGVWGVSFFGVKS